MLVTDAGKLIRCPVNDVRIAGRNTQGVRIFKTDDEEKVVSVEHIPEDGSDGGEAGKSLKTARKPRSANRNVASLLSIFSIFAASRGRGAASSFVNSGDPQSPRGPRRFFAAGVSPLSPRCAIFRFFHVF